ncbi:MAG: hypothetical protein M3412_03010 [Chloroflexota bacterium]|jgi:hypothetical protein|nr:hypothetical protein [Chloroflexota bacterium]
MLARVERQTDVRFGFYLRPSLAMSRAQVEIHNLVARQYGSMTAGKFMPHATIKGFYRSDAPVAGMVAALSSVLGEWSRANAGARRCNGPCSIRGSLAARACP